MEHGGHKCVNPPKIKINWVVSMQSTEWDVTERYSHSNFPKPFTNVLLEAEFRKKM